MKLFRKSLWLAGVTGTASALFLALAPGVGQGQDGLKQISIISTASVNGEVSPCG